MVKIYTKKPDGFQDTTRVVACFIERENTLLFLRKEDRFMLLWGNIENDDKVIVSAAHRILYSNMGVYIKNTDVFKYCGLYFLEGEITFSCYIFKLDIGNQNFEPTKSEYDFLLPHDVDIGKLNVYEQVIFEKQYINK